MTDFITGFAAGMAVTLVMVYVILPAWARYNFRHRRARR